MYVKADAIRSRLAERESKIALRSKEERNSN